MSDDPNADHWSRQLIELRAERDRLAAELAEARGLLQVIDDLTPAGTDPWRGSSIQADLRAFLDRTTANGSGSRT